METTTRYHSLDILKLICALLVVFIHSSYPYKAYVLPLTDIAVPCFFMISGFLVYSRGRSTKRIKRIALLFLWASLLYLFKTEAYHLITEHQLWIPTLKNIIDLVVFNDVAFSIHLWYLPAYVYVLLIAFLLDKYNKWSLSFCSIIPLIVLGAIISSYSPTGEIQYSRNFLFYGMPFFLTGAAINYSGCRHRLKITSNKIIMGGTAILLLGIHYITPKAGVLSTIFSYLLILSLCASIMCFTVAFKINKPNIASQLGKSYSTYIYIFHMLFVSGIELMVSKTHLFPNWNMVFNPFIICICSIALAFGLKKLRILK